MALLGIDIGTSSAKAVIASERGEILAEASEEYGVSMPHPGWTEQDPETWWHGAVGASARAISVAGLDPRVIRAIGLSGQMHGSVLLDRKTMATRGEGSTGSGSLRPAILWNDQRTAAQCVEIERLAGGRRELVELVGNAALPGFTLPKLLWIREHEPEVWARVAMVLLPKDFVGFRLTGVCATDVGDASGTLLLNPETRAWSDRALGLFGIDRSILPPAFESGAIVGEVTHWAAAQLGVAPGTPVVAGSGDNQAGAIGAGIVRPGQVLATLGTSGVIYAHADRARRDLTASDGSDGTPPGRLHTMCAADGDATRKGAWSLTGCTLAAAGALTWARDVLAPGVGFEELLREAEGVARGSGGLLFLPSITGERCPHPDPLARGAWVGLTARHTRAHLIRAVVEGVTYTMAEILDIVRSAGVEVESVRLAGGGARSRFWRQLQADCYGVTVATTNTEQGPAFGAALLAGVGTGVWRTVPEATDACVHETERIDPDARGVQKNSPAREAFAGLHAGIRDRFPMLASIDRDSAP
jgi:xylulokinase